MLPPGAEVYSAESENAPKTWVNVPLGTQLSGLLAVVAAAAGAGHTSERPSAGGLHSRRGGRGPPTTYGILKRTSVVFPIPYSRTGRHGEAGGWAVSSARETPGFASPPRGGFALDSILARSASTGAAPNLSDNGQHLDTLPTPTRPHRS